MATTSPNFMDEPQQLSFPRQVRNLEHKVLYALWREGMQCVVSLGLMTDAPTSDVKQTLDHLVTAGKVDPVGPIRDDPFAVFSLNKKFVAELRR